jgi:hypothetical protein
VSKPSAAAAQWATASVYATSADPLAVGEPTKEDPSSIAVQGWDFLSRPRCTFLNHWMHEIGNWASWIDSFSSDAGAGEVLLHCDYLSIFSGDAVLATPTGLSLGSGGVPVTIAGAATLSEGLTVPSAVEIGFSSGGLANFTSGSQLLMASGSEIVGDPVFNGGTFTWASPQVVDTTTLSFAGTGHIRGRAPVVLNSSGAQTIGINNGDEFVVPVLSGTLAITLSTTGAGTGSRMRINACANIASGFSAQVTTAEGSYLMRADSGGLYTVCLDLVFYSGAWHTSCPVPAL